MHRMSGTAHLAEGVREWAATGQSDHPNRAKRWWLAARWSAHEPGRISAESQAWWHVAPSTWDAKTRREWPQGANQVYVVCFSLA